MIDCSLYESNKTIAAIIYFFFLYLMVMQGRICGGQRGWEEGEEQSVGFSLHIVFMFYINDCHCKVWRERGGGRGRQKRWS
jgi:hypothetical protein